jgi:L-alanine-DL-glutamate epimerase-like enolase superfamily enzyme
MLRRQLIYAPYTLTTAKPFGTAHGSRSETHILLVELIEGNTVGIGEASMPPYYPEKQHHMLDFMNRIHVDQLLDYNTINSALDYINSLAPGHTASKAAIDIALHDLRAKQYGLSLDAYLKINRDEKVIQSSITIGLSDIDRMLDEVTRYSSYPILKIKLGQGRSDINIIKSIREHTQQRLWIDANQGWRTLEEALIISKELQILGVEVIEQPFPVGRLDLTKFLSEQVDIAIIADEDCQCVDDIQRLASSYDGINIKIMKCGGIRDAVRMIEQARLNGLSVMLGCMTESSVGISAAYQLAHLVDYVDLDGNMLINNDPAIGVYLDEGSLNSYGGMGIQCRLKASL